MKTSHRPINGANTQNSAHQPKPAVSLDDLFKEARLFFDGALADEEMGLALRRSGLMKGKRCGGCLNQAKAVADEKGDDWLPLLAKAMGEEKIRTCQVFMQIAREWAKIEPEYAKNPNLTLHDALRILRGKETKAKMSDEERKRKMAFSYARNILQRVWTARNWSDEEIGIVLDSLRWGGGDALDDLFADWLAVAVNKLKRRVRRKVAQEKVVHNQTPTVRRCGRRWRAFFSWDELECSEDRNAALHASYPYASRAWPKRWGKYCSELSSNTSD